MSRWRKDKSSNTETVNKDRKSSVSMKDKRDVLKYVHIAPILCWVEKFTLLIDFFQIFGVLWCTAQPYPWPYLFSTYTRYFMYVNLDFFSMTSEGALVGRTNTSLLSQWGTMNNYIWYAMIFALGQFLVFMVIPLMHHLRRRSATYGSPLESRQSTDQVIAVAIYLSHLCYLPCLLAVSRLFYCETKEDENGQDQYILSADYSTDCLSSYHVLSVFVCSTLVALPLFGLPILSYKYIKEGLVYDDQLDHEKCMQKWEIRYILGLDDYWLRHQLWLTASFKKYAVFSRVHVLLFKATMLVLFVAFRWSFKIQSTLIWFLSACGSMYYTMVEYPYRCGTTNVIMVVLILMMFLNSSFAMVNAFGTKTAATVASNQTYIMGCGNLAGLVVITALFLYTAIKVVLDWPAVRTIHFIRHNPLLSRKATKWVNTIKEAKLVQSDFLSAVPEIADIGMLEEAIRQLRKCWVNARSCGSIFELIIGDVLEELIRVHATHKPASIRRLPYWDASYVENSKNGAFRRRNEKYSTMAPRKRRILVKLVALSNLMGSHRPQNKFDVGFAQHHAKLLGLQLEHRQALADQAEREAQRAAAGKKKKRGSGFGFKLLQRNMHEYEEHQQQQQDLSGKESLHHRNGSLHDHIRGSVDAGDLAKYGDGGLLSEIDPILAARKAAMAMLGNGGVGVGGEGTTEDGGLVMAGSSMDMMDGEYGDYPPYSPGGTMSRFDPRDVAEATAMIARLVERTELAMRKHHLAKVTLNSSMAKAMAGVESAFSNQHADTPQSPLLGELPPSSEEFVESAKKAQSETALKNITTMDVIKDTADEDERNDLEELFLLWDEAIKLYEVEEFPGDPEKLNDQAENWYTYRQATYDRLQDVLDILDSQNVLDDEEFDGFIEDGVIDEEDDGDENYDDDEEEDGPAREFTSLV